MDRGWELFAAAAAEGGCDDGVAAWNVGNAEGASVCGAATTSFVVVGFAGSGRAAAAVADGVALLDLLSAVPALLLLAPLPSGRERTDPAFLMSEPPRCRTVLEITVFFSPPTAATAAARASPSPPAKLTAREAMLRRILAKSSSSTNWIDAVPPSLSSSEMYCFTFRKKLFWACTGDGVRAVPPLPAAPADATLLEPARNHWPGGALLATDWVSSAMN